MRGYAARWVLPIATPPIRDGAVLVADDGRIAWVGPRADAPGDGDAALEELGDAALLPGLVNVHTHLELTAFRGLLETPDFFGWVRTLTRARAAVLTEDLMRDAARLGVAEGLAAGVTTFADTSSSGVPLDALVELGARGIVFQEVFGPAPAQRADALETLQRQVAALRARATPQVRVGVSPHAVYSVHEDLLVDACAWALGEQLPLAIHASESQAELDFLREARGPFADMLRGRGLDVVRRAHSPVHLLAELGVAATASPLLIHGVQFDASDVALLAHYDCPVAHCPASNAKLGHGVAPLRALLDAGVRVGLGTDSVASNDRLDLLDEARHAVLAQRAALRRGDALSAPEALRLATLGGAEALGLAAEIGSLEPGKHADLAAFALTGLRGDSASDPATALVFALAGRPALLTVVAGAERARAGAVTGLDPAVPGRVRTTAERLAVWLAAHPPEPNPVPTGPPPR